MYVLWLCFFFAIEIEKVVVRDGVYIEFVNNHISNVYIQRNIMELHTAKECSFQSPTGIFRHPSTNPSISKAFSSSLY